MECALFRWGTVPYREAWERQREIAALIAKGAHPQTLILLQHPHTFTFGRSGHLENLLWDKNELRRRGVEVVWSDRGGDVTYHGPGQLVAYPLLRLGEPHRLPDGRFRLPEGDYVGYLRRLESVVIAVLRSFGIFAFRMGGMTGVWVRLPGGEPAKIAAIGVRVDSNGISQHGVAINVAPQMEYWQGIVGCGLQGYAVASMAEMLGEAPSVEAVADEFVGTFAAEFGCMWGQTA